MKKSKMLVALLLVAVMVFSVVALVACDGDDDRPIELLLWAPSGAQSFYTEWSSKWAESYTDSQGRKYTVKLGIMGEGDAASSVISSAEDAADVFCFADDQVADLVTAGALASLGTGTYAQGITERNTDASIEAASYNGELVAYPMQADNTYYLYYNTAVFSEEDLATWDTLWNKIETVNGDKKGAERKKVLFDFGNAWYQAAWFFSFGGTVSATDTNFDSPEVGYKALQAAYNFSTHQDLLADSPDNAIEGLRDGSIAACVAGTWIYSSVTTNADVDIKLAVLPNIVFDDATIPMVSFMGSKLMGVNAQCPYVEASHALANYLTGEEVQIAKAKALAAGPSNINAAANAEVAAMPTVQVVAAQSLHSYPQSNLPGGFWDAIKACVDPVKSDSLSAGDYFSNGDPVRAKLDELLTTMRQGFFNTLGE